MKIKVKAVDKQGLNTENDANAVEIITESVVDATEQEKQERIKILLDHFEKEAADSPDIIKDKDVYLHSAEFESLTDEDFDFNKKRRADLEGQIEHLVNSYAEVSAKNKRIHKWQNYLVYLVVITAFSTCVTFSKYISTVDGSSSGTVASFDVSVALLSSPTDTSEGTPFSETSNSYDLSFKSSGEEFPCYVRVTNNSDVTVDAIFEMSGADNHGFAISTNGTDKIADKTVQLKPGASQVVYLYFYGATKTVTDANARLTITVQQVD